MNAGYWRNPDGVVVSCTIPSGPVPRGHWTRVTVTDVPEGPGVVLKWNVPVDDETHEIGGGPVCFVGCQSRSDIVQVWTIEDPTAPSWRRVGVFGTGQPVTARGPFLGTAIAAGGFLVWHVFQTEVVPS